MDSQRMHVMTLANSIIGVSILAMPYCFKQCGIILSILSLLLSSIISRLACHFLLKSAIKARLKTFEFLAYHAFGSIGKLIIEIGMIGFLIGTCIAFFVVMGDLGPEIIAEMTGVPITSTLRTSILMALALFCVLPLGLLRNVDSLSGVCTAAIAFYGCLVLKIIAESIPHILLGDWFSKVEYWRPAGILQCLPIFSMALFCQTQLFEIYQAIPNASLEKMNNLIRVAVNICTCVYIFVGVFGYIAVSQQQFSGNILLSFKPSIVTSTMKIGFVLSVAFSFPLVIFPCRASLHSLLYKSTYMLHEGNTNYIPEGKFKGLTFVIVFVSLVTGVMIPNIELVLGLVGSTIGVMICVIFPATCFICLSSKNTNERILAQIMLFIGVVVMVLGTYANLYAFEEVALNPITDKSVELPPRQINIPLAENQQKLNVIDIPTTVKIILPDLIQKESMHEVKNQIENNIPEQNEEMKEIRHEPPQPEAPPDVPEKKPPPVPSKSESAENVQVKIEPIRNQIMVNQEEIKEIRHEPPQPEAPREIPEKPKDATEKLPIPVESPKQKDNKIVEILEDLNKKPEVIIQSPETKSSEDPNVKNAKDGAVEAKVASVEIPSNIKLDNVESNVHAQIQSDFKNDLNLEKSTSKIKAREQEQKKGDEVDIEAIKKEEKEIQQQQENDILKDVNNQDLIESLQKHNEEQQQKLTEEKLKAVKEIEIIAKKAIESLVENNNNKDAAENVVKQAIASLKHSQNKLEKKEEKPLETKQNEQKIPDANANGDVNAAPPPSIEKKNDGYNFKNLIPIPVVKSNNLASFYPANLTKSINKAEVNSKQNTSNNNQDISNVLHENQNLVNNTNNNDINKKVVSPIKLLDISLLNVLKGNGDAMTKLNEKHKEPSDNKDVAKEFVKLDGESVAKEIVKPYKEEALPIDKKDKEKVIEEVKNDLKEDIKAIRRDILSESETLTRRKRENQDISHEHLYLHDDNEHCDKTKSSSVRK